MFDVCWSCREWNAKKRIRQRGTDANAVCPDCGHPHPFRYLPLLVITGASGTGKSTVLHALVHNAVCGDADVTTAVVPLESDALWAAGANMEPGDYMDLWQGICVGIHQSGRPVLLFGAGMNPTNMETVPHRDYFPRIHYLALVAEDETLTERLAARPDWRESSSPAVIREHVAYNRALQSEEFATENVPFETLDTTGRSIEESAETVVGWIRDVISEY